MKRVELPSTEKVALSEGYIAKKLGVVPILRHPSWWSQTEMTLSDQIGELRRYTERYQALWSGWRKAAKCHRELRAVTTYLDEAIHALCRPERTVGAFNGVIIASSTNIQESLMHCIRLPKTVTTLIDEKTQQPIDLQKERQHVKTLCMRVVLGMARQYMEARKASEKI